MEVEEVMVRRKVRQVECSCRSMGMDERLWSRFPEDVLDRVIAHLPLAKICQLRSLCRRWKEPHLFSCDFLETLNRRSVQGTYCPFFVSFHNMLPEVEGGGEGEGREGCLGYEYEARKWRKLPPLACFPCNVKPCEQATGSGGLLLLSFKRHFLDCIAYSVCNPVTGQWAELPTAPDGASAMEPLLVRLIVDRDARRYQVVLVERVRNTYVFDSRQGCWSFLAAMPLRPYGANVVCNGALYCVGLGKTGERIAIMKCDFEHRRWKTLPVPLLKFCYVSALVDWQGTLLVVIDISSRNRLSVYSIAEAELELERMKEWSLVAEMPQELVSLSWPRTATCIADKQRLYFSKLLKPGCFHLIVYHFLLDKWEHVVDTSGSSSLSSHHHLLPVPFQPDWTFNCSFR